MNELKNVIWVAHTLFERGLVTGSTGNISFRDGDVIYVSKSGSCFGLIDESSFAKVSLAGEVIEGNPSKEWPMHIKLYQNNDEVKAVIHTHSFFSTLVSCIDGIENKSEKLFEYTPYLKMQTGGKIGVVNYGNPGSEKLFESFNKMVEKEIKAYILKNHGIFAAGENILKAFYLIEEFEQSAKILLNIEKSNQFSSIK